jgi:GH15 family glucan-1,4-alpha-glucosidase
LPGYPGGGDIVGNHVRDQFQLDVFGEALLLFATAARHDRLDGSTWRAAETAASAIAERWREADAGIWEIESRHWTHSRMVCSAGLRAIARHSPTPEQSASWLSLADAVAAACAADAVHESGRWQRAPDDERLDASLLLLAIRGAVPKEDPRSLATLRAVERELASDGYVYRYQPDERPLGDAEGAFLLCGFLMALACDQQGDALDAVRWFERNRSACGPPALLAEEYDVRQRQLRGNLPQAFVHALLLETAVTLTGEDHH